MGVHHNLVVLHRTRKVAQDQRMAQKIYHHLPLACAAAVDVMQVSILTLTGCHTIKQYVTSTVGEIRGLLSQYRVVRLHTMIGLRWYIGGTPIHFGRGECNQWDW